MMVEPLFFTFILGDIMLSNRATFQASKQLFNFSTFQLFNFFNFSTFQPTRPVGTMTGGKLIEPDPC